MSIYIYNVNLLEVESLVLICMCTSRFVMNRKGFHNTKLQAKSVICQLLKNKQTNKKNQWSFLLLFLKLRSILFEAMRSNYWLPVPEQFLGLGIQLQPFCWPITSENHPISFAAWFLLHHHLLICFWIAVSRFFHAPAYPTNESTL